ncbi:hypothetical protein O9Z70_12840 [Devosia sp. YIM 151766]|uniref:hypothetical protein n=1 Tax=Devosia sp. YIM 151766 TaxID=3017325 RepID=UPI00255C980C|nr:hypothetical protein [Devosia sp. YIM 151766]WIY52340.1 hypothetical protein O9Z70_12840 [Devosia sp. YIM 151766]
MKTTLSLVCVFASALMLSVVPALGQFSLDEIEASVGKLSDEMGRVDALLGDTDPNKRLAAMDMLIKSGNADYATRAREVGLFSSDKQMQRRALAAVFDAGGPFRFDIPLTGVAEDATRIRAYIKNWNTGVLRDNESVGQFLLYTAPFDEGKQCWTYKTSSSCAVTPTGEQYVFTDGSSFVGSFKLMPDATLAGEGSYRGNKTVSFVVNLVE